jgi:hypothetical protein
LKGLVVLSLGLLVSASAGAGELIFDNGSRLAGDLSNQALMVSTGSGLIEIVPDEVVALSREEIRLRDGRVIRGTLVGGQVKARTALGEIAVKVDELQAYRAGSPAVEPGPVAAQAAPTQAAPSTSPVTTAAPVTSAPAPASGSRGDSATSGGLPMMAAYQPASTDRQGNGARPGGVQSAGLVRESPSTGAGRMVEIVVESALYRDALSGSSQVGRVTTGQMVRYVDSIDRRLLILNLLVFDGGHWVKVRLNDGTEGWVPADNVREVR